jgi:regulatory protein
MKIIQSSRLFRKGTASNREARSRDGVQKLDYKEVDAESLSQANKSKSGRKGISKIERESWKSRSKKARHVPFADQSQNQEEFDFDTSKLEAMPKGEVAEPIVEGKKRRRSELNIEKGVAPIELVSDPVKKEFNELFARGVRLLAMREHSVKEITNKLFDKSENTSTIYAVVDELQEKKYLSDERFTEGYIRARSNRGFGPVKIQSELKTKGVADILIQYYLDESASVWFDIAKSQYQKKYGETAIGDYSAWTKRARFMQSRGFTMEQIHVAVPRCFAD